MKFDVCDRIVCIDVVVQISVYTSVDFFSLGSWPSDPPLPYPALCWII